MHRTIEVTVPPENTDPLIQELVGIDHVIGLSVQRGASLKPPGDVLTIHTLNRGADQVMRLIQGIERRNDVSVVTVELASITDLPHQAAINDDVDEALWEEMGTGLRHQARITGNFLVLMTMGGSISAAGLVSADPSQQAIAFVAASVIAPGFEPIAKIPLGLVLRRWEVVWGGLRSFLAGYAVLVLSAAVSFVLFQWAGTATAEEFVRNPAVEHMKNPGLAEILVSACGAVAGIIMVLAYRRSVIAGPLIALLLIQAAAMLGMSLAIGRVDLALDAAERLGLDVLLVVGAGMLLIYIKQQWIHQRAPMR